MTRIKINKYFYLDEFVDPRTYFNCPNNGLDQIDNRLFDIALLLRESLGNPLRINNWWHLYAKYKNKKSLDWIINYIEKSDYSKWSGYRPPTCPIGAKHSSHKKGLAIDPKGDEAEMFKIVKKHAREFYNLGVRRIEDISITHGWLHLDMEKRNQIHNAIRIIDRVKQTGLIKL